MLTGNGTACAIAKFRPLQTDDWRDWILEIDKYCARSVASGVIVRDRPHIRRSLSQGKVRSQPVPDHDEGALGYQ